MSDMNCECERIMEYYKGFKTEFAVYKVVVPVHTTKSKETYEWEWVSMPAGIQNRRVDMRRVGSRDLDILKIWLGRSNGRFFSNVSNTEASYLMLCHGYEMADLKDFLDNMGVTYDIYEYRADGDVKWTEDLYGKGEGNVG